MAHPARGLRRIADQFQARQHRLGESGGGDDSGGGAFNTFGASRARIGIACTTLASDNGSRSNAQKPGLYRPVEMLLIDACSITRW